MTSIDFARNMGRLPDEALVEIAFPGAADDYDGGAIDAARAELDRRGVSKGVASQILMDVQADRAIIEQEKATVGLGRGAKLMFGFFSFTWIALIIAGLFTIRGYTQKSHDAWMAIVWGFACWAGFSVVLMLVFVLTDLR
jgi:hypothetical protein